MTRFSLGKYLLPTYVFLTFLFLMVPIGYTFVFSFNDSIKSNIIWRGFTLDNWLNVCDQADVCGAFGNSLLVAVTATTVSTVLGTMIAIALVRYRFKFRSATNLLLFLPLATPEVVMGAGLAAQFLDFGWTKGLTTVIIAHVMFLELCGCHREGKGRNFGPGPRGGWPRSLRVPHAGVLEDYVPAIASWNSFGCNACLRSEF
jgi:spermidine/putrescine transport system permease protein